MLKVEIKHLIFKNNSIKKEILKNINFLLKPGNIYSIFGLNGSGKTTLLNSIIGNLDKRFYSLSGNIYWDETNIFSFTEKQKREFRKKYVRYVFQDAITSFDPLKKLGYYFKNIAASRDERKDLLNYFHLPDYKTISDMHSFELSGGMAQRLSVVLALLSGAKLILLDEPTSALDIPVSNLLRFKLEEFCRSKNVIILVVTQDLKFGLNVSDYVAFLKNGKLSAFSHSETLDGNENILSKFGSLI